jgi:5-methylcytosine-specific restriction endonuclease McrA
MANAFGMPSGGGWLGLQPSKKKRVKLTPGERVKVWEHPEMYGRTCNICGRRITKLSELELDHTRPYSKGGTKMNLAHHDCNRIKGSKSLGQIQKKMAFKRTRRTVKRKRARRSEGGLFGGTIKPFRWG